MKSQTRSILKKQPARPKGSNLARKLLDVVPTLMHELRQELAASRAHDLSMPHYRVLSSIRREVKYVSTLAQIHGVSQPAMSKMVEQLSLKGYVRRVAHETDRRLVSLEVTARGEGLFQSARKSAQANIERRVRDLGGERKHRLFCALVELEELFLMQAPARGKGKKKK